MSLWINRTVLSGASVSQNGTSNHTCTFTPATSGNFLVAVVYGGMTFTTPSGWTLPANGSAVGNGGLYVFTRTATAGLASFATTHNGSNYGLIGVVYEFPAGTTFIKAAKAVGQSSTAIPGLAAMTGTYTAFSVRGDNVNTGSPHFPMTVSWTKPANTDLDGTFTATGTDNVAMTVAYEDGQTAATYTPVGSYTDSTGYLFAEEITFALSVAAGVPPNPQDLLLMF